jgi:hypothetical protein
MNRNCFIDLHVTGDLFARCLYHRKCNTCKGTLPLSVFLVTNENPNVFIMFIPIDLACIPCVRFKYGCHEYNDIPLVYWHQDHRF